MARRSTPGSNPVQVSLGCEVLTSYAGTTSASPDRVWRVVANGWLFAQWAIGAVKVCRVDDDWPSAGSSLDHAFGHGRFVLRSETRVLASTPGELLRVRTDGWPTGGSELTVTLESGPSGTILLVDELAVAGPDHVLPPAVHTMLLQWRNTQLVRGLALLAEGSQT